MLGSLFGLVTDVVKIAAAPIEVALDVTRVVTKPVADIAEEVVDTAKELTSEIIGR
jgi:hypothetical protein